MQLRRYVFALLMAAPLAARADSVTSSDRQFLIKATQDGLAEIKVGQLAIDRGMSNQVRELGRRLVDDHTRANQDLARIADRLGVRLPTTPTRAQQAECDRLSRMSPDQFDRAFLRAEARDHDKAIKLFEHQARTSGDRQIRQFAERTLPTLRMHRDLALGTPSRKTG